MYYNYVINNSRRTVTIREYNDFGDRVATYRTFPYPLQQWPEVRDRIVLDVNNQDFLKTIAYGTMSRKIR